ncbi:hypothetical protein CBOM_05780 [Ceraceosorus bombacis]|uniref:Secreted protein n=1 Tax=Ceraceosorus bombacis TaxID=401625 RepID=A0A0N7LBD8_9BASI|nr:hypothetical protein CBOM_05780 [Ceraceosorus bombacis]
MDLEANAAVCRALAALLLAALRLRVRGEGCCNAVPPTSPTYSSASPSPGNFNLLLLPLKDNKGSNPPKVLDLRIAAELVLADAEASAACEACGLAVADP